MDVEDSFNSHADHGLPYNHYADFPQQASGLFSAWPANQPAFGHGISSSSAPQEECQAHPPPEQAEGSANSSPYPLDASGMSLPSSHCRHSWAHQELVRRWHRIVFHPDRTRSESIPAKMHIRRPGKDNWTYLGRVSVYQDLTTDSPIVGKSNPVCLPSGFLDKPCKPFLWS